VRGGEVAMSKAGETSASSVPEAAASLGTSEPSGILADVHGPIPTFPPRAVDERGRLVPLSAEERGARKQAILRTLAALRVLPDGDAPDTLERLMRGIDENRSPDRRLFEGIN
jgi:hypothetical protein